MVYISEGNLMDKRTWFRLSIISDFFWGILNFIVFFFQTLTSPMGIEKDKKKRWAELVLVEVELVVVHLLDLLLALNDKWVVLIQVHAILDLEVDKRL